MYFTMVLTTSGKNENEKYKKNIEFTEEKNNMYYGPGGGFNAFSRRKLHVLLNYS